MRKILLAAAALAALAVPAAAADNVAITERGPISSFYRATDVGSLVKLMHYLPACATGVTALGIPGTPVTCGIFGIQGVSGMTPVRVDNGGTFAVQAAQSGNWPVRAQDGTGNALTSAARGSERALSVQLVDAAGAQITSFGGAGGTASNFGAVIPTQGTAIGASDGTNMVAPRAFDGDSGGGTQYLLGTQLRTSGSGGSVEAGLVASPLFVRLSDGSAAITTLPVSLASVPSHAVTNAGTFATQVTSSPADPFGLNADAASVSGSISAKLRQIATNGIPITGTVTVGSHAVTNAGTFAVQAAQSGTWNIGTVTGGGVASGAADSGNPLKVGGVNNTTLPTIANGQRGDFQIGTRGALNVTLMAKDSTQEMTGGTTSATGVTAAGFGMRTLSPMYAYNGSTLDIVTNGAGTAATAMRTTQASDSPLVTATGAQADAAWVSGSGSVISLLKNIAGGITASTLTGGTDASPSSTTVVPMHQRPHAAMLTKAAVSFSSSGDQTIVTRTTGTIKVYRLKLACASEVSLTFKNGTGTNLTGAMPSKDVYFAYEGGEPHFVTTSTNNFVINAGTAVACGGQVEYIDS